MIDHYEIQSRRPGLGWDHVGNIYPAYKWVIRRPWYYLWLIRCPRIVNTREALIQTASTLAEMIVKQMQQDDIINHEEIRIILWCRSRFGRLWRTRILEA